MAITGSISSSKAIRSVSASTKVGVLCALDATGNHLCGGMLVLFLRSELAAAGLTQSQAKESLMSAPEWQAPSRMVVTSVTTHTIIAIKPQRPEKFECQDNSTLDRSGIQVSVKRFSVFRDVWAWQSVECCPYHVTSWTHA